MNFKFHLTFLVN